MKFTLLILILSALAFSTAATSCVYTKEKEIETGKEYKTEKEYKTVFDKMLTIQEINQPKAKPGIYSVEGFVIKTYSCPPCPPGMGCAPCRRADSIVISLESKKLEDDVLTRKEILLHTDKPESFEIGKKYLFKIEITDEKLPNDPELRFIKIIDSKAI